MKDAPQKRPVTLKRSKKARQSKKGHVEGKAKRVGAAANSMPPGQADGALNEIEDRYQDLVEHSHDMIYTHDLQGRVLFANQASAQMLGLAPVEVVGRSLTEFLVPEVRDQFDAYLAEIRENGMASGLMLVRTSTGETRVCEYNNNLRTDGSDGPIVRCIARDVTERRLSEAALQESEERFRQLSEAALEGIILHENETILEVNQSFCRMYGYERAEVIGKSILDLALPQFREQLRQLVQSGYTDPYESPALCKDGTVFDAEVAGKPIYYRGRLVRVGAIRDISEKKRNERRQAAQYAVTRVLAESASLAEATPQLLQVICESLRWKLGEFWRVCDGTNLLRYVQTWHVPGLDAASVIEPSRQTELAPGVGLLGRVWQSGQPAWIPDVATDPIFKRAAIAAKVGLHAAVAFPISVGSQTLGVMLFLSRRVRDVDEDLLRVLSAIGSQIGQFTERKRAEAARRQAEEEYRTIFENAVHGIYRTTADGRFITANPAMARMLGFISPEELIHSQSDGARTSCMDPQQRDEFVRSLEEHGFVRGFEYQGRRKDGSKIWLSESVRAVRDQSGTLLYYEGMSEDITGRKQADIRSTSFATLAQKLSGARTPADAARIIVDTARELLGWDACTLSLYDAGQDLLYPILNVDTIDGQRADLTPETAPFAPSLRARQVIDQGAMLILREEPCAFDAHSIPFGDISRPSSSIMCVPMRRASTVVGLLSIQSYTPRAYDEADLNDLQALADWCGEALNRIRVEVSLYESEKRYRDLIENSHEMICTHDLDGRVLSANPAAVNAIGYDHDEYVGKKTIRDLLAPEVKHQFGEYMTRLCKDGTTTGIMLVQTKSGERRVWEYYNSLRTEGVATPIVRGMARDITDRKRAEAVLRRTERRLSHALDATVEGYWEWNVKTGEVFYSPRWISSLGYSPEDVPDHVDFVMSIIHPHDVARVVAATQAHFEGHTPLVQFENRLRMKSGEYRHNQARGRVVERDEAGNPVRMVGTDTDITERKQIEEALRESEQRYRELFENSHDAIYVHDLNGRYTAVNHAAEELSGYTREEIVGKHYSNFVAPRNLKATRENFCRKLDVPTETTYEAEVVCKNGARKPVEVSSRMIYQDGVAIGIQGTARDISERKRAQDVLQTYARRLVEAQEAERQKIARELHDEIGQVLTAIRLNLQAVQASCQTDACIPRLDESISVVDEALKHVRELSLELRPSLLDDLGLAAALRWYAARYSLRSGIVTEVIGDSQIGQIPHEIETACFRITQEALTNTARHAAATKASVQLTRPNGRLCLNIRDNGIGFDSERYLHGISSGSALGLRGMQERALAVKGHVEINSSADDGTQVIVTIPLSQ